SPTLRRRKRSRRSWRRVHVGNVVAQQQRHEQSARHPRLKVLKVLRSRRLKRLRGRDLRRKSKSIADCQLRIADFKTFGSGQFEIGNWQSAIGIQIRRRLWVKKFIHTVFDSATTKTGTHTGLPRNSLASFCLKI